MVISIRYASIRSMDISNGEGVGVALFVQGCRLHCNNCFNPETWDFSGGKEWTDKVKNKFLELANRPYIKRISILGGEPLAEENLDGVLNLVNEIRLSSLQKSIWLYTGYQVKEMCNNYFILFPSSANNVKEKPDNEIITESIRDKKRNEIISQCTVIIDGQYIDSQRDITLPYRGSKNQRLIDVQQSLQKSEIVIWQI